MDPFFYPAVLKYIIKLLEKLNKKLLFLRIKRKNSLKTFYKGRLIPFFNRKHQFLIIIDSPKIRIINGHI